MASGLRLAAIDRNNNALLASDGDHHEIHVGDSYRLSEAATISANASHSVSFKTPNTTKQVHLLLDAATENSANITFYELSECTSGNAITPRNANRSFADGNSGLVTPLEGATIVTTNAVTLAAIIIGSAGSRPNSSGIGGAVSSRSEWVLKRNTWYSVVILDVSTAEQRMWIGLDWYEHTPRSN